MTKSNKMTKTKIWMKTENINNLILNINKYYNGI